METQENKILARIRKMMALANDAAASEGERDNALRMSYNLLAKYNLSMVDVENAVPQERRDEFQAIMVSTIWSKNCANIIANLFFCKYYSMGKVNSWKGYHVFVGKESNATTAMVLTEYVITSILKEARKLYKDDSCPAARSFALGVVAKLRERVREIKAAASASESTTAPANALVLTNLHESEANANSALILARHGELKKGKAGKGITNGEAFGAGKQFGSKINLAPQVGSTKKATLALN
jgi:hypothetical protein